MQKKLKDMEDAKRRTMLIPPKVTQPETSQLYAALAPVTADPAPEQEQLDWGSYSMKNPFPQNTIHLLQKQLQSQQHSQLNRHKTAAKQAARPAKHAAQRAARRAAKPAKQAQTAAKQAARPANQATQTAARPAARPTQQVRPAAADARAAMQTQHARQELGTTSQDHSDGELDPDAYFDCALSQLSHKQKKTAEEKSKGLCIYDL